MSKPINYIFVSHSLISKLTRWFKKRKNPRLVVLSAIALLVVVFYVVSMHNRDATVDTRTLRPLMNLIAEAESNDNYNAYFGSASNDSLRLTEMTITEVQRWQAQYVADGSPSSAVGRYQIISTTLDGLVRELDIEPDEQFDESMQDRLAIALLNRRGAMDYVNGRISARQFAANLSMEWAALPRVIGENPSDSYYASDGLNQSRVSADEVLRAVWLIQPTD